mgnify:CR=1 FL=1
MFFGWFNAVFSIVFPLIFFGLMCLFIFTLISNLRTWNKTITHLVYLFRQQ